MWKNWRSYLLKRLKYKINNSLSYLGLDSPFQHLNLTKKVSYGLLNNSKLNLLWQIFLTFQILVSSYGYNPPNAAPKQFTKLDTQSPDKFNHIISINILESSSYQKIVIQPLSSAFNPTETGLMVAIEINWRTVDFLTDFC